MDWLILFIASFFCLNMGATSFASSFTTAYGSGTLSKARSQILFIACAVLGALIFGEEVAHTLGNELIPSRFIDGTSVMIILTSAAFSLFVANLMHIPQSTSLSTIASICGVGLYHQQVSVGKIQYLAIWWVISTALCFLLIYGITRFVYPPKSRNFWIYEKLVHHQERLKQIVIWTSCYKGFAQGTNNVANAVGPLMAAGEMETMVGLLVMGIIFGLGAYTFVGPMKTSSERIVPLGLLTATIINVVSGTLTIIASRLGIPFPTVIVYTVAIFAIGSIKDGAGFTFSKPVTQKTFYTWCINPFVTLGVSYLLSYIFLSR